MDLFDYSDAIFSPDRKYRYMLSRTWDNDKFKVAFIGLNPSRANEDHNDQTIQKVMRFAHKSGAGGFYMLNLFPFITPYPDDLVVMDNDTVFNENIRHLIDYAKNKSEKTVFCWGAFNVLGRDEMIKDMFPDALCLGKNKDGSPAHPLYLPKDTPLIPFH